MDPDTTRPTGDYTEPEDGAKVSSPVWLRAEAEDNPGGSGIDRVRFTTNCTGLWTLITTDDSVPYENLWDMAGVPDDQRCMLGIEIYDNAGNRTDHIRWITKEDSEPSEDKEPPEGDYTEPERDATVSAPVWLKAEAKDNEGGSGIAKVRFTTNCTGSWTLITDDLSAPYEVLWDMEGVPDGKRCMLGIEIHDKAGNDTPHIRWITKDGNITARSATWLVSEYTLLR